MENAFQLLQLHSGERVALEALLRVAKLWTLGGCMGRPLLLLPLKLLPGLLAAEAASLVLVVYPVGSSRFCCSLLRFGP